MRHIRALSFVAVVATLLLSSSSVLVSAAAPSASSNICISNPGGHDLSGMALPDGLAYLAGDLVLNICGNVTTSSCASPTPVCLSAQGSKPQSWGNLNSMGIFRNCHGYFVIRYDGGDSGTSTSIRIACDYLATPGVIEAYHENDGQMIVRMKSSFACVEETADSIKSADDDCVM